MNWRLNPIAYDGTRTPLKSALFLVLCLAWVVPGLVGHDPWKTDEAIIFSAVQEMLRGGDWLVFRIAGDPVPGRAPLFLWTAAIFTKAFGGIVAPYDAARLATGFFMSLTLAGVTLASYELMGERALRMSVLLFIGCLGLFIRAHEMNTDVAGLAGLTICLVGLAWALRRPVVGGVLSGVGLGLAFLGNGFLPLAMGLATFAALPCAAAAWRTRAHATTVALALLCATPLVAAWPLALAVVDPPTLHAWWAQASATRWSSGVADGLEGLTYFLRLLPWYAWPAWPLAAWTLYRARRTLPEQRGLMLPAVAFFASFIVVSLFGEVRDANAMPLLVPLALLGVAEIESLPRGAASALDWFGVTTFFLAAALLWIGWIAAITGAPQFARAWLQREVPGFTYPFSFLAFALAALLTLIWLVVVARSLRSARRALVNWSAGIAMLWMLVMTLGVPLVDQARSYRSLTAQVVQALPPGTTCVAQRNVGDAQRALFDYFGALRLRPAQATEAQACRALLVQGAPGKLIDPGPEWQPLWQGSRPGDRSEVFGLYLRAPDSRSSTSSTQ